MASEAWKSTWKATRLTNLNQNGTTIFYVVIEACWSISVWLNRLVLMCCSTVPFHAALVCQAPVRLCAVLRLWLCTCTTSSYLGYEVVLLFHVQYSISSLFSTHLFFSWVPTIGFSKSLILCLNYSNMQFLNICCYWLVWFCLIILRQRQQDNGYVDHQWVAHSLSGPQVVGSNCLQIQAHTEMNSLQCPVFQVLLLLNYCKYCCYWILLLTL